MLARSLHAGHALFRCPRQVRYLGPLQGCLTPRYQPITLPRRCHAVRNGHCRAISQSWVKSSQTREGGKAGIVYLCVRWRCVRSIHTRVLLILESPSLVRRSLPHQAGNFIMKPAVHPCGVGEIPPPKWMDEPSYLFLFSSWAFASRSSLVPSCSGMDCGIAGPGWAWWAEKTPASCWVPCFGSTVCVLASVLVVCNGKHVPARGVDWAGKGIDPSAGLTWGVALSAMVYYSGGW